jgi:CrcB protein
VLWIAVGVGGGLGALARHLIGGGIARLAGQPVPWATAVVNVLGCVCAGALAGGIASGRLQMSAGARAFVFVGILGGFTTFSAFALDTLTLVNSGRSATAMWNVAGQVGIGLLGVFGAYALALKVS